MKSNVKFKIVNPNTKTQLENALVDIVAQQLIRKDEEYSAYIENINKTC